MHNPNPALFQYRGIYYCGRHAFTRAAYAELANQMDDVHENFLSMLRARDGHSKGVQGNKCDHCGAIFGHGVIYQHAETGLHYIIGHQCAASTFSYTSRAEMLRARAEKRGTHLARIDGWKKRASEAFINQMSEDEELAIAWDYVEEHRDQATSSMDGVMIDIHDKMMKFGKWSTNQRSYFLSLAKRFTERLIGGSSEPAKPETVAVPEELLDGRHRIEGTIIKVDWRVVGLAYYDEYACKVTIKDDRGFLVWGTLPSSALTGLDYTTEDDAGPSKGDRVVLTARISVKNPGDNFGFFKRPTKCTLTQSQSEADQPESE